MQIITSPAEMGARADELRAAGKRIGFVPTLGNLHQGHANLINAITPHCKVKVVSIFVNPVQFGAGEDLANYPRSEQEDLRLCQEHGAEIVLLPQAEDIYAGGKNPLTQVNIPSMSSLHCGVSRPTHFMGVLTIVSLLFNLVKPHCAAFGKKDFQQLRMIQIMSKELHFPVEILAVDTGRAADGLALSSRNRYLTEQERALAPQFYQQLRQTAAKIRAGMDAGGSAKQASPAPPRAADIASNLSGGNRAGADDNYYRQLERQAKRQLAAAGFKPDYINIARRQDLLPANPGDKELALLGAVYLGKARLIDNILV